jgi:hypothetical protein
MRGPKKLIAYLEEVQAEGRKEFAAFLEDGGWLDKGEEGVLPKLRRRLAETTWLDYEQDREYILHQLNRHLKKIKETKYNMKILNGPVGPDGEPAKPGMHKFRRDLRWFLLFAEALNGAILLDAKDCPLKKYRKFLNHKLVLEKSPYLDLPGAKTERRPCYLPKCLFVAMTALVEELGDLKDLGEATQDWLTPAILASHYRLDPHEASKVAQELLERHPNYTDYVKVATKLHRAFMKSPVLDTLRDAVKERPYRKCDSALLWLSA